MLDTYDYTNCFEKENEELAVTTLKDNIKEKLLIYQPCHHKKVMMKDKKQKD